MYAVLLGHRHENRALESGLAVLVACLASITLLPAVLDIVGKAPNFNGWLVLEEESETAGRDPAAAVKLNRQTMRGYGA